MTELAAFAGRFHPLLVHFPIALLLLAALLRAIETRLSWFDDLGDSAYRWSRLVLALGALSAVASASTGWLLRAGGGYAGDNFHLASMARHCRGCDGDPGAGGRLSARPSGVGPRRFC